MKAPSHPFIIYNASAGSGKTFTLAGDYISNLLLSHDKKAYTKMLAITFTNKAVAEMKRRIVDTLWAFSQKPTPGSSKALLNYVKMQTQLSDRAIQSKSKTVLKNILHNYAGFEISTIDSFNQRILRTFAKDLHIPMNFEVELDTEEILSEAVDRVIAQTGKDQALTETLINFAFFKADDDKSWDISKDLNDIAKLLTNENNFPYLEQLRGKDIDDFDQFQKKLNRTIKTFERDSVDKAEDFFLLLDRHNLKFNDFNRSYLPKFLEHVRHKNFKFPSGAKWQTAVKEGRDLYRKKASAAAKGCIEELQPEITDLYTAIEHNLFRLYLLKKIRQRNPALSLLTVIEKEVSAIKKERGLLLISEFNKTIDKSIKNQPVPFIYERLGERYHTFYIDEFQDTSVLQWKNMQPLIENSLASGKGQVTLVGDTKQSIYRWRGGKAEQFMALCEGNSPFRMTSPHIEKLPNNFRSLYEIVNFNNKFFAYVSQTLNTPDHQKLFKDAHQNPAKKDSGFVDIRFITADNKGEETEEYPKEVLNILNNLKESSENDRTSGTNQHLNDVCILVRKRSQGIAIADYLSKHGIPIISSETLLLKKSGPVIFLIDLLKFALNPFDDQAKFGLLTFVHAHQGINQTHYSFLKEHLNHDGQAFFDNLATGNDIFNLARFTRLPLYSALDYGIRVFNLQPTNAYLQFFLDFVYEYTQTQIGGIQGLLDLWDLKKDKLSITAPDGQNAVRIMTIHKAKGLEFRVVIFPFANEKINDTRQDEIWTTLDTPPNDIPVAHLNASSKLNHIGGQPASSYQMLLDHTELDVMNLNYVALTRAEEQLYILSCLNKKGTEKPETFSGMLVGYLKSVNRWNEIQHHYEIGRKPAWATTTAKTEKSVSVIELKDRSPSTKSRAFDIVTKSGRQWGTPQEDASEEGTIIHNLFKEVYHPEDIDPVVKKAVINGWFADDQSDYYRQLLSRVVSHDELAAYFSDSYTSFTEKEIITDHKLIRLDRLCLKNDQAVIIDYKTGERHPDHRAQINAYAKVVNQMKVRVTDKILVYLAKDAVEIDKIP